MQNLILLIFFLSAMDGANVKFANLTAEDRWTLVSCVHRPAMHKHLSDTCPKPQDMVSETCPKADRILGHMSESLGWFRSHVLNHRTRFRTRVINHRTWFRRRVLNQPGFSDACRRIWAGLGRVS